jgi:hypothetical protein
MGNLHEEQYKFVIISRSIVLRVKSVWDKVVEKIKKHILYSKTFLWVSCHLWDNVEKYCRAGQATDDNMAHAHCMQDTKVYKYTLRICNIYCFSTATMVARMHPNITLYVNCLYFLCFMGRSYRDAKGLFQVFIYKGTYRCVWSIQYIPLGRRGRGVNGVGCTFMIASFWRYFLSPSVKFWKKFDVRIQLTRMTFLVEVGGQLLCFPHVFALCVQVCDWLTACRV